MAPDNPDQRGWTHTGKGDTVRVRVDREKCQGHNRCYALAPELFDVDDYGDAAWLVAGVAASVALVLVNHVNLAVMLRLARGRPLRFSGLLSPTGLLADLALASLGVVLAYLWDANPYLLPLALAPLVLVQRSFRLLARLGESEERFRTMFEGAPIGTVILDLERRIVATNRVFEELVSDAEAPEVSPDEPEMRLVELGRARFRRRLGLRRRGELAGCGHRP